jgi:hypothetical protein
VKGIWSRSDPAQVVKSWQTVMTNFGEAIHIANSSQGMNDIFGGASVHAFSDTVIIAFWAKPQKDPVPLLLGLANAIVYPFVWAFEKGIFLRGVISVGDFWQAENLLIGPAVDEAAEWYEQPDWIGVSAAPSARFGIERMIEQRVIGVSERIGNHFVHYAVPIKTLGPTNTWALAWPRYVFPKDQTLSARALLLAYFAQQSIGPGANSKYENALRFFDFVANQPVSSDAGS